MKKFLLTISVILVTTSLMFFNCYAAYDNTTNMQGLTPSAAFTQTQNNFTAIKAGTAGGVLLPSGAVFFMLTGSCPTGTTDVSSTYANKFLKINATQGTSSGVALTLSGTTDSHTLTIAEIPAHTHTITTGGDAPEGYVADGQSNGAGATTGSAGGGGGHTHTLTTASATILEPSSLTCRLCSVD